MRIRDLPILLLPLALIVRQPWGGVVLLALAALGWIAGRRRWRWRFWALLAIAIAALNLSFASRLGGTASGVDAAELRASFTHFWTRLDADALRSVDRLKTGDVDLGNRLALFRALEAEVESRRDGNTLLLLDPSQTPVAWAGEGLLHELGSGQLPVEGPTWRLGFTAATLVVVHGLPSHPGWSVVAGRSFSTDSVPMEFLGHESGPETHWAVAEFDEPPPPGVTAIAGIKGGPVLWVRMSGLDDTTPERSWPRLAWRVGVVVLGLALLVAAGERRSTNWWFPALLLAGAASCGASAAELSALDGLMIASAVTGIWLLWRSSRSPSAGHSRVESLTLFLLLLGQAGMLLWMGITRATAMPIAAAALLGSFGALVALQGARWLGRLRAGTAVVLTLLSVSLVVAAGLHAGDGIRWVCLVVAVATGALYLGRRIQASRTLIISLLLLVALLGGAAWSVMANPGAGQRATGVEMTPPPTSAELQSERALLSRSLGTVSEVGWVVPDLDHLDSQDLALYVWRHSPLARTGVLSALSVYQGQRLVSSFSFGLPMRETGELDRSPSRWQDLQLPGWENSLSQGEGELLGLGGPLALRYWVLLRPGFRNRGDVEGNLAAGLLRGSVGAGGAGLTAAELSQERGQVTRLRPSPLAGAFRVFTRRVNREALVASGMVTAEVFLLIGAGIALALLLWVPFKRLGEAWQAAWHSYSQRLVMVFALLVLLTLLPLNAVMVGVVSRRLDSQQLEDGLASLESTQRVLGEYVLSLEPGFSLDTTLNDELLTWLSRVVHHQVNLYWGSSVYASSRPELFTAGLLPVRIPGEIYSRLALTGAQVASRRNRVGETSYLELYAPLRIPGTPGQEKLFVSLPLLAQQEAVASEMRTLRRRTLLAAGFLFLVLSAVGARLARSFTRPLHQIIEGTHGIAAGATSLEVSPADVELAALARAIDDMAHRIAEGRERLMGEKRLVEKVVENVTSGVVSLDSAGRVRMCNRVARELLGVAPGDELRQALHQREGLKPVLAVLDESPSQPALRTLQLGAADDGAREWTAIHLALPGTGDPTSLLIVEDVTEVVRGQRLAAWAEMARIIAHEVKNPLTPIQLSTEHLREVWQSKPEQVGPVLEQCTANILKQVEELREIAGEFSTFSQIPRPDLRPGDLVATVREVVSGYQRRESSGTRVDLVESPEHCTLRFDARLMTRALRNLLENALRAAGSKGEVTLRVACEPNEARIEVLDSGPGVAPDDLNHIFEPYFSTHEEGTGLGLPISLRIAEEHGGTLTARNDSKTGGLLVTLRLPRERSKGEGTRAADSNGGEA